VGKPFPLVVKVHLIFNKFVFNVVYPTTTRLLNHLQTPMGTMLHTHVHKKHEEKTSSQAHSSFHVFLFSSFHSIVSCVTLICNVML
jgi:hypothetical protein